jgi:hypothetical protein
MSDLMEMIEPYLKAEGVDRDALVGNITDYVEKAKNSAVEPLAANKQEILNEKKELSEKYKTLNESVSWLNNLDEPLTQEKYNDMISEMTTLRDGSSKSEEELADKLNQKYQAGKENAGSLYQPKLDALTQKLKETEGSRTDYKNKFQNYLVQNKINEAIQKTGATPSEFWREGFMAASKPTFNEEGLEGISVRHNGTQIPLEEWVNVFPNTDEGKRIIPAGVNTGGGAKGGASGSKSPKTLDDIDTNQTPEARRAALKKLYNK